MDLLFKVSFTILACLFVLNCSSGQEDESFYREARRKMVREQIQKRGIDDARLLDAMLTVNRHLFVPSDYRHLAYADRPLPIGEGQTISQPYIVALMTHHLHIKPTDRVLEIGTGSGYQAAVLAKLAAEVYSIEIIETLAKEAQARLRSLGYENVWVKCGDGFFGWEEHAPFDAIIITCAAPKVPVPLSEQLKEGGRMILPLGGDPFFQSLTVVTKKEGKIEKKNLTGVVFVPMTGEVEKLRK